jgi:hypothetical protein
MTARQQQQLEQMKSRFNGLLATINGSSSTNFSTTVETGYEALALATVMAEYRRAHGAIMNLTHPTNNSFLNQKPGRFRIDRSFKMDFVNGKSFYFAADVEVFGLEALNNSAPTGTLFEADIVVIPTHNANAVIRNFQGYPAPQHIDSAYECKFGSYHKGQLREFLGLKRHLCFLGGHPSTKPQLFGIPILQSRPDIALKLVRPRIQRFFDTSTASLYDLEQIIA